MPEDLRTHSKKTKNQLVIGFFVLLFTVGLGLIWLLYGRNSALMGLFCLLGVMIPAGVIFILLTTGMVSRFAIRGAIIFLELKRR